MNILLLMSGSIACAKAAGLISLWKKRGHDVKVVCSNSVFEFIGKATIEGLSGHAVVSSTFEEHKMMDHIHLSRWADKIVFAPATANSINKISAGIADDMLTTTWVAALTLNKPLYLAPAMNSMMWRYPATQSSIDKLKSWGVTLLMPQSGELACGESGDGRLMEIEDIDKMVFIQHRTQPKHILITAGGTREYVDGVRYIGNLSTGRTGAVIADYFSSKGHQVTWLGAINAIQPEYPCHKIFYETFNDLAEQLQLQLKQQHFDTVIHAAAISDFSVSTIKINEQDIVACRKTKLPTSNAMDICLKKNPKLVSELLNWSQNKNINVVAFKLTNTNNENEQKNAINKLLSQDVIHYVVHNDLSKISKGSHPYHLYHEITQPTSCPSTQHLCQALDKLFDHTANDQKKEVKTL